MSVEGVIAANVNKERFPFVHFRVSFYISFHEINIFECSVKSDVGEPVLSLKLQFE